MMTITTKLRVPARSWRSIAGAICLLRLTAPVQADVTPVPKAGASTPFTTLEAEAGELSAGARVDRFEHGSPVPPIATLELEASGGGLVELAVTGAAVTWRNPVANANTIVIRSSIPDTPSGGGLTSTLNLYVDGKFRQAIPVSSKQSWVYRGGREPGWSNDPKGGGMPFKFYNEDRAWITGAPLPRDSRITLRKDEANTAAVYHLDCIDLEHVEPPLAPPAGSLSINDYGADPTGATDAQAAIQKCLDDARQRGLVVWIPPGRYLISSVIPTGLDFKGVTVRGAGMWHTMLYRQVPLVASQPNQRWRSAIKAGTKTQLSDLSIDSNAPTRAIGLPGGSDYGIAATGEAWLIQRVWVQHCDAQWLSGSNGTIRDCRVADSWGDGINLNNGNTPDPEKLGINLTAENNFVRGTGDDCLATYSDRGEKGANGQMVGSKFLNNTGSAPYWANCLRVAGGKEVVVRNNLLMDSASNCGMTVGIFGKTGHALESALIEGNVILRGGGWNGKDRHGLAVGSRPDEFTNAVIRGNVIKDSWRAGLFIGPTMEHVTFEGNRIIHPAAAGVLIARDVQGTGAFTGNTISDLATGQPAIKNDSEKTFEVAVKENPLQKQPAPK